MKLRDVIDKDHFYIEGVSYSDDDLKKMSFDELEALKMRIQKKIDGLSLSLKENPAGKGIANGLNNNQKRALYINQRVQVYVNSLMRKLRQPGRSVSDYFMEEAKIVMPQELFEVVLSKAHRKMGAREGA